MVRVPWTAQGTRGDTSGDGGGASGGAGSPPKGWTLGYKAVGQLGSAWSSHVFNGCGLGPLGCELREQGMPEAHCWIPANSRHIVGVQ